MRGSELESAAAAVTPIEWTGSRQVSRDAAAPVPAEQAVEASLRRRRPASAG
jgi:hypothetical protein